MGKPVVKGEVKIKAQEYVCPGCGYTEPKEEHEAGLKLEVHYTCPECRKEGESTGEYKRKRYKGVPSYIVLCQHCQAKIALTRKLKKLRGKKAKGKEVEGKEVKGEEEGSSKGIDFEEEN